MQSKMKQCLIIFILITAAAALDGDKQFLMRKACEKNPRLTLCSSLRIPKEEPDEMITPPPLPPNFDRNSKRKDEIEDMDKAIQQHERSTVHKKSSHVRHLSPEEQLVLRSKCERILPLVQKNCQPQKTSRENANRCAAYFRDCVDFMPKQDPLYQMANSFSSQVGVDIAQIGVNGIPYYPINEEGGVGVDVGLNAPFGAWGGGYSDHVGVRDYWSQHQEVGANWVEGKYGYKNGWNVPLVQSLGIEGGQHNTVSVPLTGKDAGTINVDNGYGVGPYYGHNDHVGVDWKKGQVNHNFGVGVPFAGVGFNTGQAVAFPGPDVWARALGR